MPELGLQQAWEALAVVLAVAYLVLAIRQNIWCWAAAAVSTGLYLFIMYHARLYMESALQVFYLAMAAYGWYQWRRGGADHAGVQVTTWPWRSHLLAAAVVFALVFASGFLLERYSDAALPFADAFTTWAAVVATWMMWRAFPFSTTVLSTRLPATVEEEIVMPCGSSILPQQRPPLWDLLAVAATTKR